MHKVENLLRKISIAEKLILGIIFSALVILISYQIVIRWIGLRSLSWVEELCQHLWVCTTMLAVSIGTTEDGMMKVSALESVLPKKFSKLLTAAVNLFCGGVSVYFAIQAYKAGTLLYKINSVTTALRMPIGLFYIFIAICFAGVVIRSVVHAGVLVQEAMTKSEEKEGEMK